MNEFRIRPYSKRELALLYFPECKRPELAVHNLRAYLLRCRPLMERLLEANYKPRDKMFLKRHVELIVEYLGEP